MSDKSTKVLTILVVLSALIGAVITLYPDTVGYKYDIKGIREKKGVLMSLKDEVIRNEEAIENKLIELNKLEEDVSRDERNAKLIEGSVDKTLLSIHIPSILIFLEQNAIETGMDLEIGYGDIKTFSGDNVQVTQQMRLDEGSLRNDKDKERIGDEGKEKNGEEDKEIKISEKNTEDTNDSSGNIEVGGDIRSVMDKFSQSELKLISGISTTIIPIKIIGNFGGTREFIRKLDEVDLLEPSIVNLFSDGEEVRGYIVLQIFHEGDVK